MLITWDLPNLISGSAKQGEKYIDWMLLPGMNDVPDAVWAAMCEHPLVKMYLDKGVLSAHSAVAKGKNKEGLMAFDVAEAKKVILKTYDIVLLEKWKTADDRDVIKSAIEIQFKEIDKQTKKTKKKKVEEEDVD